MAYRLTEITIRTNNTPDGMNKIAELWQDVTNGTLPILFDSEHNFQSGISPVSRYSNYASDEKGDYDLSILGVEAQFFGLLDEKVNQGLYKKYDAASAGADLSQCTQKAWEMVWAEQASGQINRAFTQDYESSVPAEYTKDGQAHCYLYIALKQEVRLYEQQ